MKYFKRFTTVACAVLALGLVACSNDDDDDSDTVAVPATVKDAPDAVGDIVLNDGTAIAAAEAGLMSAEQKAAAVAVIFYVERGCKRCNCRRLSRMELGKVLRCKQRSFWYLCKRLVHADHCRAYHAVPGKSYGKCRSYSNRRTSAIELLLVVKSVCNENQFCVGT